MDRSSLPFRISTVTDGDNEGGDPGPEGGGDPAADAGAERTVSLQTMQDRIGRATANANREKRELKEKLAALQASADELTALKNADKTAQERLADELAAVKAKAAAQDAEIAQLRLASENGIGESDRELIGSGAEADLAVRAKRVGELLTAERELAELKAAAKQTGGAAVIGRPLQQGVWGRPGATPTDVVTEPSAKARGEANAARIWGSGGNSKG